MITAETHSDDRAVEVNFDATPYFQKAPDEDLARLIECGFAGDQAADQVAIGLADSNPEIGAMFAYLEARNKASRKSIGFEVSVNEDEALTWLRQHRPIERPDAGQPYAAAYASSSCLTSRSTCPVALTLY